MHKNKCVRREIQLQQVRKQYCKSCFEEEVIGFGNDMNLRIGGVEQWTTRICILYNLRCCRVWANPISEKKRIRGKCISSTVCCLCQTMFWSSWNINILPLVSPSWSCLQCISDQICCVSQFVSHHYGRSVSAKHFFLLSHQSNVLNALLNQVDGVNHLIKVNIRFWWNQDNVVFPVQFPKLNLNNLNKLDLLSDLLSGDVCLEFFFNCQVMTVNNVHGL